jgi:hypothetical protein
MNKAEYWKSHISLQRASGLSQAKYCVREGVNESSFGYWSRRLGASKSKKPEGQFVAVGTREPLEVVVSRVVIRVPAGSDLSDLRRVVEALTC